MLSYYTDANKFGRRTYFTHIASNFQFHFLEKGDNCFEVQLLERGFFKYKSVLTFQSERGFEQTIVLAFDQLFAYFLNRNDVEWTQAQKTGKLNQVLQEYHS
jgi:hypothetical protein